MVDAAVIFDVDGVLLELTSAEEDVFFALFEKRYGLRDLSRDWNSYAIRNDESIIAEILARHGLPAREHAEVVADYFDVLKQRIENGVIETIAIPGTRDLLNRLQGSLQNGHRHRKPPQCRKIKSAIREFMESGLRPCLWR